LNQVESSAGGRSHALSLLFNRVNFENYIGVQSSPFFGRANAARQDRTIQFSTRYKF